VEGKGGEGRKRGSGREGRGGERRGKGSEGRGGKEGEGNRGEGDWCPHDLFARHPCTF